MNPFKFEILHSSKYSQARVGRIHTPHGVIDTPGFVAVGTNGTLKSLSNDIVESIGLQLMFCNTYHLLLHPGTETVKAAGGLHAFIQRKNPLITDSGGFQVFSLAYGTVHDELKSAGKKKRDGAILKIGEEGVLFRSYRDGKKLLLTPETSITAQKAFGADIIIPFDELPPYHIENEDLKKSFARTHRWEMRSLNEHLKNPNHQAIYSVIHGGINQELRRQSVETLRELPFDGHAIGGSVGKTKQELHELISFLRPLLPDEKPNHLLGIADLESLQALIPLGIDTFDSCYPTKAARHGMLLTNREKIDIHKTSYRNVFEPIDKECHCLTCQKYTLAYLHHLFKAKEFVGGMLATIHNLHFMVKLMENYREMILQGKI